jgi:2,4-dienoyl-CoA reductase-like NADH-dependent reductase (Old Yellow Enzyme family)
MVAPSAIPFDTDYGFPVELTKADILKIITAFGAAAERALKAGFDVIELHGAHGYLIDEFLSPLSNKRTDEYGGSFENRIRFLLEIVRCVRKVWLHLPLFLRISASDWVEGGWTIDDSVQLASVLKNEAVDLIDCSSGGIIPRVKIPAGPSYQVPFSQAIRTKTGILTGAVGIITTAQQAESILVTGQADVIIMAREMLRNPYFPLTAADDLGYKDMKWPVQYERAKRLK